MFAHGSQELPKRPAEPDLWHAPHGLKFVDGQLRSSNTILGILGILGIVQGWYKEVLKSVRFQSSWKQVWWGRISWRMPDLAWELEVSISDYSVWDFPASYTLWLSVVALIKVPRSKSAFSVVSLSGQATKLWCHKLDIWWHLYFLSRPISVLCLWSIPRHWNVLCCDDHSSNAPGLEDVVFPSCLRNLTFGHQFTQSLQPLNLPGLRFLRCQGIIVDCTA